ncbi:1-aminocyclopropane-1-carboxylate synthase 6 [Arabidopsis thaliana]|jgi:1-aminocyclopropane-1-carboxylate synthase|uniref:1-aminocyclopropane-1-carboxylate synthase 6 n=7 Tax=Mesangiospermae TaxID=1437183 RepID=1A16_ARATH|nr:1-aminocyclopropane-1-carboxylic acid (acc) synthase 6 [Arabidopsis thaliana]Q9SAR0.2 RecName: Full=1-aminocyclopropane-1-carboxylate synthase 6; Short=ACC synthase 6; AltName: Full=S-adenosyl-L-methionine methylthioadenosine-lyase 6 [Arabidopsis thaliana]KAG7615579.1 Pyridoxal phosphate-dependent transferase [Arabidopsis thaliana x Arabidopsis arenosa]KAG7620077.1 Pyridoxal phosphate-dependent transferase [Arabidopsis suecica]AAK27237.1 ACC synthase ACS6 [Arabidopsis thaliana]AAL16124.1 AT|eukprot:NP_192867.1 1-aminocyclopropane-1-carboxylic acid (acc) synthase 6 [Arabidopsis thaliana]
MVAFATEKKQDLNLLSKIASGDGHGENSSYFDGWKAYEENPFHPIDRPDGVIQMGLAENQLCGDLMRKWVLKHPEASICTSEGVNQFSDIAIFQDYHGLPEFRQAVAKFMEKTRNNKVKFDPDRIVMSGGATGAHETVAFCLANPGDGFLVPTPYYPGFDRDLRWRTGVNLVPVTCHSSNGFKITVEALEAAYENARKSNIPVKGLLVTNPSNPLGTTLDRECLKSLVNFTNDKGIHLIADEIYAATTFGQSEFISVAEVIEEIEDCNRDLIHIVYSLSKDMGLPGLRVGIVYSYNDRVVQIARKMSSFGLVSSQTQHLIAKMLSDEEFVDEFIRESKLRLAARHAEITTGLDGLGIGWLKAKAGLFLWMDLRNLLKTATFDSETELWRVIVHQVKLNVSPGGSFHCHEPGWFRVCFANMDHKTMETALERIRVFTSQLEEETKPMAATTMMAKKKKKCWQSNLRLSFSDTRRFDDGFFSPHSPVPPSPLVRAQT